MSFERKRNLRVQAPLFDDELGGVGFGPLNALCLMVFSLLYIPCAATQAVIRRESRSTTWMLFTALFQLAVAWVLTFLVYRIGLLLGVGM